MGFCINLLIIPSGSNVIYLDPHTTQATVDMKHTDFSLGVCAISYCRLRMYHEAFISELFLRGPELHAAGALKRVTVPRV